LGIRNNAVMEKPGGRGSKGGGRERGREGGREGIIPAAAQAAAATVS
jgi:hypothetical protein